MESMTVAEQRVAIMREVKLLRKELVEIKVALLKLTEDRIVRIKWADE